jgi:hypothetical protein
LKSPSDNHLFFVGQGRSLLGFAKAKNSVSAVEQPAAVQVVLLKVFVRENCSQFTQSRGHLTTEFLVDPVLFFDLDRHGCKRIFAHFPLKRDYGNYFAKKAVKRSTKHRPQIARGYFINSIVFPCIHPVVPSDVVTRYHGLCSAAGLPIFTGSSYGRTATSSESIDGSDLMIALIFMTRPLNPRFASISRLA